MAKAETILDTTTKRGVYLRILRGKDSKIYLMVLKRNQKIFLNEEEIRELQDLGKRLENLELIFNKILKNSQG